MRTLIAVLAATALVTGCGTVLMPFSSLEVEQLTFQQGTWASEQLTLDRSHTNITTQSSENIPLYGGGNVTNVAGEAEDVTVPESANWIEHAGEEVTP